MRRRSEYWWSARGRPDPFVARLEAALAGRGRRPRRVAARRRPLWIPATLAAALLLVLAPSGAGPPPPGGSARRAPAAGCPRPPLGSRSPVASRGPASVERSPAGERDLAAGRVSEALPDPAEEPVRQAAGPRAPRPGAER